jgi:hypothetical protein
MIFNKNYIIILSLFGLLLLYSYYYFLKDNNNTLKLWGSIKGNFLKIYYLSMLLSLIGFMFLFNYLLISDNFSKNDTLKIFVCILLVIIISMFWAPLSLQYLKTIQNIQGKESAMIYKYIILVVLFLVSLFSFLLLISLYNINDNKYLFNKTLALIGMLYFFIHVFLFDFILWSYNFFL